MGKVNVNEIDKETGSTLTLGGSGTAVTLACGATQTGFGRTGTVDWQTGSIKTATFTAANGEGYFANTSGGAFNMNLPVGSAGSIVSVADYGNTFQTNNLTIVPNGSQLIGGTNANAILSTQGQSVTFVYVDGTKGWVNTMDSTSNVRGNAFITASGGTVVTCGNFKTHIFTGTTNFVVTAAATDAANNVADYMVVAGGGGGGKSSGGGGGAGGFRMSNDLCMPAPTTSPLAVSTGITLSAQSYPITIGAAGAGTCSPGTGTQGGTSVFSTISSAGGGGGEPYGVTTAAGTGGSGGGGGTPAPGQPNTSPTPDPALFTPGSAGNTPPVSPAQGNNGGAGFHRGAISSGGGGGGGAGAVGAQARDGTVSGTAGGTAYSLTDAAGGFGGAGSYIADGMIGPTAPSYGDPGPVGSARYFAGGGGGGGGAGGYAGGPIPEMNGGGAGGGGNGGTPNYMPGPSGASCRASTTGTTNTGGGGGGRTATPGGACAGANGGSGVVMIRYKYQ
jgi:hypothetical protein